MVSGVMPLLRGRMPHYLLGHVEIGQAVPAVRAEHYFRKSLALMDSASGSEDKDRADQITWAFGESLYRQ